MARGLGGPNFRCFIQALSSPTMGRIFMTRTKQELWARFKKYYAEFPAIGLAIDVSRMNFSEDFLLEMEPRMQAAFAEMAALEKGAVANADEDRMVGHYWLRDPGLAPDPKISREIADNIDAILKFAEAVHSGEICGAKGPFKNILVIGIGGSALGPQFVAHALSQPTVDKMDLHFFDNTDPDGMDKVLSRIITELGQTLCVVISKSGGTKETRNGMLEAHRAYEMAGLKFAQHAVAVTGAGSELDTIADQNKWLRRFPMWDWVGGRTSELSGVGLLPAALQGFDIRQLLSGAKACDQITRKSTILANPAALLALMWFYIGNGKGEKDMVILPYKDRLELISRYLQQLVMESLGKEFNRDRKRVNQGIAVYGNKGSTDQHAFVQQLRDGLANFFVLFIEVLRDRDGTSFEVERDITSGDYLSGFFLGTRSALFDNGRESITLTVDRISPFSVGALIALFERAVGFYASLININAYHQPGVEAGKKAASAVIGLQLKILNFLAANKHTSMTIEGIGRGIQAQVDLETVFKICRHLASNPDRKIVETPGDSPFAATYRMT